MPKLFIINITCNQGSTGTIAEHVGLLMKARGWDVYYAHGARRVNTSGLSTIPFSSIKEEYLHALKSLLFDGDGLGSIKATKRLVEKIKDIKPDVIHIHNLHGYYINIPVLFDYLNGTQIPVVITLHDCWAFTGHCFHFVVKRCNKWQTECDNCPLQRTYPTKSLLFDNSRRNYNYKKNLLCSNNNLHIVAVSEWLKSVAEESFLKEKDIRFISNGLDLSVFKPTDSISKTTFNIIAVSNVWYKDKGIYDYIKLSKLLQADERIILVGSHVNKYIKEIPSNIIKINHTDSLEELVSLYNQADVVISLSYAETFGLTIAEGISCGTPAVVYDNTALKASVSDKTGFVVKTGDVESVYKAIKRVKQIGKEFYKVACRRYAEEHFDKDKCYLEYVNLYDSLV